MIGQVSIILGLPVSVKLEAVPASGSVITHVSGQVEEMVEFQRMKDDLDETPNKVEPKLPRKSVVCASLVVCCLLVLILGILAGTSVGGDTGSLPVYHRLSRTNHSCPSLTAEMLISTVGEGQSFEGLVVLLECRTGYSPFPSSVKCERRKHYDGSTSLQWSNYPLCYPSMETVITSTKYAR